MAAKPKNITINGQAVKKISINGNLWWEKKPIEWRLEGFSNDNFYRYADFIDGIPVQELRVVNNTNIPIEDYRIYDMSSGDTPEYLDVSFYEDYCDIAFSSWPRENPVELQFTEPSGTYSFYFSIKLEPLDISITPQSIQYYGGRNNYFSPNTFKITSNVPIYDIYWNASSIYEYFTLELDGYNDDRTQCNFSIYPIGEEAIGLGDGNMYYIPFTVVDYFGNLATERSVDLEIVVNNVQEEYTYRIEATDNVQGNYYSDYWSAYIPYRIIRIGYDGEETIVEENSYYYEKATNGQLPPFEDNYFFTVVYWDNIAQIEHVLELSGKVLIDY